MKETDWLYTYIRDSFTEGRLNQLISDMQTKFEKAEPIPEDWIKVYNALVEVNE